jgi:hypothetical protein
MGGELGSWRKPCGLKTAKAAETKMTKNLKGHQDAAGECN